MSKIIYYLRFILFIPFLICLFLLIDKIFTMKIYGSIFFIFCLLYSIFIILSILSKKKVFITTISYNILNIGIYFYYFIIFYFTYNLTRLEIINNRYYYNNNFILMCILLGFQIIYTIFLNTEEK